MQFITIFSNRKNKKSIGFNSFNASINLSDKECYDNIIHEDIQKFGIIPELVGRLPVLAALNPLETEELVRILKEPKNAIIKQYQKQLKDPKSMQLYGDSLWVYGLDNEIGSEELKPHNYVYFSTSATNSFGGRIRNTAMINDLKFVGYAEEEPNMPNLNDDSKEEIIEYLQFLHNKAPLLAYRAMGEDMTENENFISVKVINCKKIAKKLGCEYIDE